MSTSSAWIRAPRCKPWSRQFCSRTRLSTVPQVSVPDLRHGSHTVLVVAFDLDVFGPLVALAEPLARDGNRELVFATTVNDARALTQASSRLRELREQVGAEGLIVRSAAFTSLAPGADLARLAREQDAELLLVDAPDGLLEDGRLLSLLDDAPCDVAVLVGGEAGSGPVFVPFAGAEHDWAAVELGGWLARSRGTELVLAGSAASDTGRDASRLLASASLAVQRVLGVHAEPLLIDPTPQALVDAARERGPGRRRPHRSLAKGGGRTCPDGARNLV